MTNGMHTPTGQQSLSRIMNGSNRPGRKVVATRITSEVVAITPAMAEGWLKMNYEGNRKLRQTRVDRWAREMTLGRWRVTHQGIAFNLNGQLVDGQHRLAAIVASGCTVSMMVTRGVEDFDALDQGATRSFSDVTQMPAGLVATARALFLMESALIGNGKVSVSDVTDTYRHAQEAIDAVWQSINRSRYTPATVLGALAFAYPLGPDAVLSFGMQLRTGELLERGDPAFQLRGWMDRTRAKLTVPVMMATCNAVRYALNGTKLAGVFTGDSGYRAICSSRRANGVPFTPIAKKVEGLHFAGVGDRSRANKEQS